MSGKTPRLHEINASQFLLCLFEHYHEGVLITDKDGVLIYYNRALGLLDGLDSREVLGRAVTEVYQLDETQSTTMQAIRLARPVINRPHFYKARNGRLVNSISSAYPLFDHNALVGAVCTVADYSSLMANVSLSQDMAREQRPPGPPPATPPFEALIYRHEAMKAAVEMARRAAATPSSVMLVGETGVGKELFARAIHHEGPRKAGPFLAVNCAAIPSTILEGILFGTTRGTFTGAVDKAGLLELAHGGVLFLDELDSLPVELQPKLLRVLQERQVRRLGAGQEAPVDLKIISAVNDSPFKAIEQGRLRPDLFYRLGVVIIPLPPLRERREDIKPLLNHFLKKLGCLLGRQARRFSPEAFRLLEAHPWPGNVRELEHMVEAVLNVIPPLETVIQPEHLKTILSLTRVAAPPPDRLYDASEVGGSEAGTDELDLLTRALRLSRGNVARAARSLGYSPQRLHYRLKKLGLSGSSHKPH
jgi:arginine utilization regulatory protein